MFISLRPFLILCFLFPYTVFASEGSIAVIESLDETFNLAPYIEFIEDSDFSIAYEDIQSGNVEHLWQLNTKSVFIGSDKKSRYWFRIKFHFSSELLLQEAVLVLPPHSYIYGKLHFGYRALMILGELEVSQLDLHFPMNLGI